MAGNAANILMGAATVAVGPTGGSAVDIGFTRGGTTLRHEVTGKDIMVDQSIGVVKKLRQGERLYVVTTLVELTLENLRVSMNLPAGNLSGSTLTLGYNNSCVVNEHKIVLVGVGPSCTPRTVTLTKATRFGTTNYKMSREEESVLEVEWEVLKDSAGIFGTIVDT